MIKKIVPAVSLTLVLAVLTLVGCGSGSDSAPGDSSDFAFTDATATYEDGSEVTDEDRDRWSATWCSIDDSMTRDEVVAAMGTPTSEFDADEAQPQSQWDRGEWNYTAFYGTDGYVEQLYINSLQIPKKEVAGVGCKLVRMFD